MNIVKIISDELGVRQSQTEAAVKLIDEGNTIPFIARYRKEATGALNDEQLRHLDERLRYLRSLEERKAAVIASIEEQGMLTEELKDKIDKASTLVAVEDLYRPYKPKKKTRASIARQKGLEGLAIIISLQKTNRSIEEEALSFVSEEKGVADVKEAISGALDIIAENISDDAQYRTYIRNLSMKEGVISSQAKDKTAESVYEMYYDFEESVNKIVGHRRKKCLRLRFWLRLIR